MVCWCCSETLFHLQLVSAAARAGVAVFCEKPVGVAPEDSRQIADVCRRYNVSMMVALPTRMSPVVGRVRAMVANGDLGTIRSFSGINESVMPMSNISWFVETARRRRSHHGSRGAPCRCRDVDP